MLKKFSTNPLVILLSILGGIAIGVWLPALGKSMEVIGVIYLTLLKMVVLPFMISAIMFSLRKLFQSNDMEKQIGKVTVIFIATMVISAAVGVIAASIFGPGRDLSPETLIAFGKMVEKSAGGSDQKMTLVAPQAQAKETTLRQIMQDIIPDNIFSSLNSGNNIKILVFTLLFGIAFGYAPSRMADSLSSSLETIYLTCQKMIVWFNLFLPFAMLAMLASQIAGTGLDTLLTMTKFVLAFCLTAVLMTIICVIVLMIKAGVGVGKFIEAFRETIILSIATCSNIACIPNTIESMAEKLAFPRTMVELLTPMGSALQRTGPTLYYAMATIFIAQLYDRPFGMMELLMVTAGAFVGGLASAGSAGVITLSFTTIACSYVKLPFEAAFVLFVAVDRICAIPRSLFNLLSICVVCALACPRPKSTSPAGN